jgi:hypothetical protein
MKPPTEQQTAHEIIDVLADVCGCTPKAIQLRETAPAQSYDFSIDVPGHRFLAEYKMQDSAGQLANALQNLQQAVQAHPGEGRPLIVVPFLGPLGRKHCKDAGVSWLDLCGNADIVAPGLVIRIDGRPNKFRERGRPLNVFASKSSRVARQLLVEPQRFQSQAELARQTGLGDGFVSKIVRRLEKEHYLDLDQAGAVRPRDPNVLLDGWRAAYHFDRHRILVGRVLGDSGDEILRKTAGQLTQAKIDHAATGLAAAWLLAGFAPFQLTSIYVRSSMPSRSLLEKIEFAEGEQGGNLWLVVPDDDAVFRDRQEQRGIQCVSAVQTYLDLKSHPEEANDAAAELRSKFVQWRQLGK